MNHLSSNPTEFSILLNRVNADVEGAFDELTRRATDRLRSLAAGMLRRYPHVRRWEETDDVYQAALIRLNRSLREVQPDSTRGFYGLAVTQIRRILIDLARHYYGVYGHGANHHTDAAGRAPDGMGGPVAQAADRSRPGSLQEWTGFHLCIESLPEEEREAFGLIWYGGMTQRAAAEVLNVSERTLIRRLNRARETIHDSMGGILPPRTEDS